MGKRMLAAWALLALLLAVSILGSEAGNHKKQKHRRRKHHWYHHYPEPCGYGSVCKDPVMRTSKGEQFYFHGHKDADFCLVSDYNLHINAHFIGRRTEGFYRDFTWVQAIGVLLGRHQLTVAVNKVGVWDPSVDQLKVAFDAVPVALPPGDAAAVWTSQAEPVDADVDSDDTDVTVTVARIAPANAITVEADGQFRLTMYAKPVSAEENSKANYGIDLATDCMAHLDVSFEFASLSAGVSGVLGQTYAPSFRMLQKKPGQLMPTMGGVHRFTTSGLLSPDCKVSRFNINSGSAVGEGPGSLLADIQPFACASASSTSGMVCRR